MIDEGKNTEIILKFIHKNFPEIGNIEPNKFKTLKQRLNVCIQCIKAYLNKECKGKFNINSNFTKTLYASIHLHLHINYIENTTPFWAVYLLQMVLICRGYNCDLNGIYTNITMKCFKQFKKDNDVKSNKYPYEVTSSIWYKLLTIKGGNNDE